MKPITICLLLLLCLSFNMYGQEIYIDKNSKDTCLFIGGINPENGNRLKVFERGKIVFKNPDSLVQVGLLIGNEFIDELFKQELYFKLSGDEPFWDATIFGDTLRVLNPEEDSPKYYKVNLCIGESMSPIFFAMFYTECGKVFGTINNIGFKHGDQCHVCEYNIPEDEHSLYEVYITIGGKAYKGCGTIRLTNTSIKPNVALPN